ncbi:myosin-J heavy chain-like [Armigeres subalbatus]|uniref:myosin-J heavy chain-like n=1 Tax=Armigeres subalbatus TaxID=124917 RepID=UPI002ED4E92C
MSVKNVKSEVLKMQTQPEAEIYVPVIRTPLLKLQQSNTVLRNSNRRSCSSAIDSNTISTTNTPKTGTRRRVSHCCILDTPTKDEAQQTIHQLGKLPFYLRSKRKTMATGKVRLNKSPMKKQQQKATDKQTKVSMALPRKSPRKLGEQRRQNATTKSKLNKEKSVRQDVIGVPGPSVMNSEQAASQDDCCEKLRQLQKKCDQHEADCRAKQDRITELETELNAKCEIIERFQNSENTSELISTTQNMTANKEMPIAEKHSELEVDFDYDHSQSDNKVLDLRSRVENLEQNLANVRVCVLKKERRISELLEERDQRMSELDRLKKRCEELTQQTLQLQKEDLENIIALTLELHEQQTNMRVLQKENDKLRIGKNIFRKVEQFDNVELLKSIRKSKTLFEARCRENPKQGNEAEVTEVELKAMVDRIEQKNRLSEAVRNSLLDTVIRLKRENRQMHDKMMEYGSNLPIKSIDEFTKENNSVNNENIDRLGPTSL